MSFLNRYKTDKTAEIEGVWVVVDQDVEWKIARINNERAKAERRALEKPYRHFNPIPDSVSESILRKVVARTVLLGWKGMTDSNGKEIPFSPDAAEKLLEEFPDFLNDVVSLALARETFQHEGIEAAKNA